MKIVISIPCLLRGGTEVQALLLAKALIDLDYYVEVCCYFECDERVISEFQEAGVEVNLLRWSRSISAMNFVRSIAATFQKESPVVAHVQYVAPGLLPILAARLARVPFVLATVHQPGTPYGLKERLLLRLGARLTDRFICVSEAAERSWFNNSCLLDPARPEIIAERRHLTIPNAVDLGAIDKALNIESDIVTETASRLKGKLVVGTVARLSPEKGIDILLKAFADVHKVVPHSHLLIVGDGRQIADLKKLAWELGIDIAVTWMGRLSWQEAMACLGLMDVVVIPSRFEGFGLTAAEAMAAGRPVVASQVDGLAEVVRDGVSGFLVTSENSSAFATTLVELLESSQKRQTLGMAARRHVEEHYAYPRFRERCRILYESLGRKGSLVT